MSGGLIGIDLGGTKILTALVDREGRVLDRERTPTPVGGPDSVIDAVAEGLRAIAGRTGFDIRGADGVGVGAPGPLDPESGVIYDPPNMAGWGKVPLAQMLEARLGVPTYVENDANAAALGERWAGAGRGIDDLVYLTVSTGIGGGLILGGRLYRGSSGTAGEVGHMLVDPGGRRCGCGRVGCLEAAASGTAIARAALEAVASGRASTLAALPTEALTAEEVARAAAEGDPLARELFARAAAHVGVGVANLVNLLNPAAVIIGGGVAGAGELLFGPVRRIVSEEALPRPAGAVRVVPAALGPDVGAVGAAAVVLDRKGGSPQGY